MIEFNGVVSLSCREERWKRVKKKILIITTPIVLILAIAAVVLGIMQNKFFELVLMLAIAAFLVLAVCAIVFSRTKMTELEIFKQADKITIEESKITGLVLGNRMVRSLNEVKKIIDTGNAYYIIFKLGDIGNAWICQKDLIVSGTLAEFEKIFQNKIVIDNKKENENENTNSVR